MSNPAGAIAGWLANYIDPAYAALGGVVGAFAGMFLIIVTCVYVASLMDRTHDTTSD